MAKDKKTLLLIDGNALIHRAFHALPPLATKDGTLVNAVYGFSSTLLSVLKEFQPDYIAASFDLKRPTFRHKKFKTYKATRKKAPDELYAQIPIVKEVVRAFNIPIYEAEGFEADDVIGTLSKKTYSIEGVETVIVTGDMDTLQLVNDRTKVFTMRRGISDTVLYTEEGVVKKYGLTPEQLPDFKGLRGDPSDNIPGVTGIGEKTASNLLQEYKDLEGVYARLEEIKKGVREKLECDKMQAFDSRWLGTIKTDMKIDFDIQSCRTHDFEIDKVVKLFQKFNFFSLIKRIPGHEGKSDEKQSKVAEFKWREAKKDDQAKIWKDLQKSMRCAYALDVEEGVIKGLALVSKSSRAWYVPYTKEFQEFFTKLFIAKDILKVGYDIKKDMHLLGSNEIFLETPYADVLIESYILEAKRDLSLDRLVLEELGEDISEEKPKQLSLDMASAEETREKLCRKADYLYKLHEIYQDKIGEISQHQEKGRTMRDVLDKIEYPLIPTLAAMEDRGVLLEKKVLEGISETVDRELLTLEKSIATLSREIFNINSPKQLTEILFQKLALPTKDIKKTKTGYSTASSELEKLRGMHPIIEKIEEYRELFKLKTTYLDVLPTLVDENSRIHTTFNQAITTTGRLSSTDPNLQNIPVRTELGSLIRTAFIAPKGYRLISADYSQIDLRCAAHISSDETLIAAFKRGEDIHARTGSEVYGVPPTQVTKLMRRQAKVLNFGILYGMGTYGFMRAAGVNRQEAEKFIRTYMERFPGISKYIEETKKQAKEQGYVETIFGRRRYVPDIHSANFQLVSSAERMAINMPIQGLTADIMKLAMIAAEKLVQSYEGKVYTLLQIHDEIIFEVAEEVEKEFMERVQKVMEEVYTLSVPLVVDVASGDSWGEL